MSGKSLSFTRGNSLTKAILAVGLSQVKLCFMIYINYLSSSLFFPKDFSRATLKYKGIHFGNSLGRLQLPITSGPGPGQYDITQ